MRGEAGKLPVLAEEGLDLSFLEWPRSAGEEFRARCRTPCQVLPNQLLGPREERPLGPDPRLDPLHDDPVPDQVEINPLQQSDFRDSQAVVVDQGEEGAVPRIGDHAEERLDFFLGQIAGQPLGAGGMWGRLGRHKSSARNHRRGQSPPRPRKRGVFLRSEGLRI